MTAGRPEDEPSAGAFKRFEEAAWSERAATYDRVTGRVTAEVAGALLDAAAVVHGARVLDVGCGTGIVTAAAAARGARATGADVAEGMLAVARERHPGLEFVVADAEALPFSAGAFEAVVAGLVVNHLPAPQRAVTEFARVLAPGGRVAVAVWDHPERAPLFGELTAAVADTGVDVHATLPPGPDPYRYADDGEMRGLLGAGGLVDVELRRLEVVHRSEDVEELWDGLLGGSARIATVIERQAPAVREHVHAAFADRLERYRGPEGFALTMVVKLGAGRRP
ncbi:MAG TPA: methyltransferase domain-containing protein [Solirubrobacteraceae bacterium]|nr:methyltransferase domain-containing protein [Solirubrobacteraceae bacterium]